VITDKGRSFVSESDNLSLGGIFLVLNDPLPIGSRGILSMVINTGTKKKEITSKFVVKHNEPPSKGLRGMGVEFIGMSDADRAVLKEMMKI